MYHLGMDIGGTFIKYALIENEKDIVKKWKKETKLFETKDEFYDYLCDGIEAIDEVDYIGISAPGVIREDSQVLSKAARNVRIMCGTNINAEVSSRLHKPTYTMNDAKAAGYCELKIGNGKGSKSSVYFVIGTGIGGCVCDEQGVIQGVNNIAGEFSNLPFKKTADGVIKLCEVASMDALINLYNEKVEEAAALRYGTEVSEKYLANDPVAIETVNEWCENIVFGLNTILIFYNPEIICLGGGISEADWFIEKIKKLFVENVVAFDDLVTTRIDRCLYNNDANILGAVLYAGNKEAA